MSDNSSKTGNVFVDAWWSGAEQLFNDQSDWFSGKLTSQSLFEDKGIYQQGEQNWKKCEEQFQAWMSASDNWFNEFKDKGEKAEFEGPLDALKSILSPMSFFNSGVTDFDKVLKKFVDVPDFADIGTNEKNFVRFNKSLQDYQSASIHYQTLISETWKDAFDEFTNYFKSQQEHKEQAILPKEALQQWMSIADDFLVKMQRSDSFLDAQNKLLEANTKLREQQKEITEKWCEAMLIPTRNEVDDLQLIVHDLRREVRSLKRELKKSNAKATGVKGSIEGKQKTKKATTKKAASKKNVSPKNA